MKQAHYLVRIGGVLRRQRELKQLSQEVFAEMLGMHRTYYSAIERGEKNLTIKTLRRIADKLDTRMSTILSTAEE